MTLSGCFGSVVVGFMMDRLQGSLKLTTIILLSLSSISFAIFSYNASEFGWKNTTTAYVSGVGGGLFFNSTVPLFLEMMMETVFGEFYTFVIAL